MLDAQASHIATIRCMPRLAPPLSLHHALLASLEHVSETPEKRQVGRNERRPIDSELALNREHISAGQIHTFVRSVAPLLEPSC